MEDNIRSNTGSTSAKAREKVREKTAQAAGKAKEKIEGQYDEKKEMALNEVQHFASALRRAGENLRDEGNGSFGATLLTSAAERLDSIGSSMGGKDLDTLVTDVERLARRNPAVFLGGAMLIGFAASRFLKSSGRGLDDGRYGYDVADTPDYGTDFRSGGSGYVQTGRDFDSTDVGTPRSGSPGTSSPGTSGIGTSGIGTPGISTSSGGRGTSGGNTGGL